MKAAKAAQGSKDQPTPTDPAKPAGNNAGAGAGVDAAPKAPPAKIGSIAAVNDNNTPGLSDLLTKAESQMKAGQFANAADTYSAASRLAPRAGLVDLRVTIDGAYIVILWIGLKLVWEYLYHQHWVAWEIPEPVAITVVAVLFAGSFFYARAHAAPALTESAIEFEKILLDTPDDEDLDQETPRPPDPEPRVPGAVVSGDETSSSSR